MSFERIDSRHSFPVLQSLSHELLELEQSLELEEHDAGLVCDCLGLAGRVCTIAAGATGLACKCETTGFAIGLTAGFATASMRAALVVSSEISFARICVHPILRLMSIAHASTLLNL